MQENNNTVKNLFYAAIDVLKHFLLILMIGILAGMSAFVIVNECHKSTYTTRVTFIVSSRESSSNAYTNLSAAQNLAEMLDLVLQSNELQQLILLDTGWERMPGVITTQIIGETNLLNLSVSATSPRESFLLMKAVLNNYSKIFSAVAEDAVMTVYAPANVPTIPDNPVNAVGFAKKAALAGVLAGILIIGFLSYFSSDVKSAKALQSRLNTALLATLPYEAKQMTLRRLLDRHKTTLLLTDGTRSTRYVEAIKMLRGKLESAKRSKGHSVFMVTSSLANEGKSTVAANLALSLAQKHYKVVLMDCDLRNPSQHLIFEKKVGSFNNLSEYIFAEGDYSKLTLKSDPKTGIILLLGGVIYDKHNRISVINTLTPILEYVREQADFVIVDTSPMAPVSDAIELADLADASLLVVREKAEPEERISASVEALKKCNASFMGCVYNGERFTASQISGGSYGKYGKYDKYGRYGRYGKYGRYENTVAEITEENDLKDADDENVRKEGIEP